MTSLRIIFCNRFFWPDGSATAQILADVAFHLAAAGRAVDVVASAIDYDGGAARLPARETERGVRIHRVATTGFGRTTLIGRTIDYLSFYIGASRRCWRIARAGDVIVAKTDPPLLSVPLALVARLRGARLVAWQQDVYPEVAVALGVRALAGPVGVALRWLRDRSLRRAARVVVIGRGMAARVAAMGVATDRIALIENWSADTVITPVDPHENPLRADWGFAPEDLIVGYSGNLGRAHDLDTVLAAARIVAARGEDRIRFLFVGGGHLRTMLEGAALPNTVMRPYQPRAALRQSLGVPDLHWLSLRPECEGLIVPSKFYGIAAAGRASLFVGDPDGEIAAIVAREGVGRSFAAGSAEALADWLVALLHDRTALAQMGVRARAYVEREANEAARLAQWSALIDGLDA